MSSKPKPTFYFKCTEEDKTYHSFAADRGGSCCCEQGGFATKEEAETASKEHKCQYVRPGENPRFYFGKEVFKGLRKYDRERLQETIDKGKAAQAQLDSGVKLERVGLDD